MLMVSELLTKDRILLGADAGDWRVAAGLSGGLLVAEGAAEPRYLDAMVKTMEDCGAYMVLTKGFALFHARPEDGAVRLCASLITLQRPLDFGAGEKDPVDVVMAFASPEPDGHVHLIQELALLLLKDGFLGAVRGCARPEEVLAVLCRFEGA